MIVAGIFFTYIQNPLLCCFRFVVLCSGLVNIVLISTSVAAKFRFFVHTIKWCFSVLEELPTVSKKDIKEALSMFSTYIKENNTLECKRFIDNYVDKIIVHRDKVELVLKVASSNFNTSESDNDSGALHITIVISREELQKYPKQRRRLSPIRLGGSLSVSYEIVLKHTH